MAGLLMILLCAVFFPGLILLTKSRCSGRKGPGLFQPLFDIRVLLRKGSVFGNNTGIIFKISPVISLATLVTAALLIPFPGYNACISFSGDFVFFAYLLALGKFFSILGALDTGSSFEGMGASREALYSMLVEPAFFILMGSLAMFTGYSSFSEIFRNLYFSTHFSYIGGLLAVYLLVQITMIENSRLPVDDPKTHLELTMIHEVMILDNSGFDLGLIQIGSALKFSLFGGLIANLLIPLDLFWIWQVLLFIVIQAVFAIIVGILESFRARNRMTANPQFILTLSSVALLAFVLVLILTSRFSG